MSFARRAVRLAVRTVVESLEDRRLLASATIGTPSFSGGGAYVPVTLAGSNAPSLTTTNFVLQNLAAPDTAETHAVDVATAGNVATFTLNHAIDQDHSIPLKDGWYDAYVRHAGLTPDEAHTSFRFLNGDFDGDGGVSINDYFTVTDNNNFGHTGRTFIQGDADYDGGVSINDFNIMAANFGKSLPIPPSADDGVGVGVTQDFALDVSWYTNPDEPRDGFKIYRSDDNGLTYSVVKTIRSYDADFWRDTGLLAGHKYWYRVRSFTDAAGAGPSVTRDWGIPISSAPLPGGLWATGIGNNSIWVEWEAATNKPASDYRLHRSEIQSNNLADYTQIATLDPSLTQYTDTCRAIGTTYYYTLTAVGTDNQVSPPLPPVSATVENQAPVITGGNDATTTGTTATVSVTATDDGGSYNLSYAWSVISTPDGASAPTVTDAEAASTEVQFSKAGYYELGITVTDALDASSSYTVGVDVQQTVTQLDVSPQSTVQLQVGQTQQFEAAVEDQFGDDFEQSPVQWTASNATIDAATGLYTAPAVQTDYFYASAGSNSDSVEVKMSLAAPGGVSVSTPNGHEANVTWADTPAETGYRLEAWKDNGQTLAGTWYPAVNATGWSINGLSDGKTYQIKLHALAGNVTSDPVTAGTISTVPQPTVEWANGISSGDQFTHPDGTATISDLVPGHRYHISINFSPNGTWDGDGPTLPGGELVGPDSALVKWDGSTIIDGTIVSGYGYYGFGENGDYGPENPIEPFDVDFTAGSATSTVTVHTDMNDEVTPWNPNYNFYNEREWWSADVSITEVPLPAVSFWATDGSAWEVPLGEQPGEDDKLVFRVERSPLPYKFGEDEEYDEAKFYPGALPVAFHPPAGYAIKSGDYTGDTDTVPIEAGQKFKEFTLTATADSLPETPESVELCIKADAAYRLGGYTSSGTINDLSIDLDVDSDNTGPVDGTGAEDRIEDMSAGVVVIVNHDDDDSDDILDFADGFGLFDDTALTDNEDDLTPVHLRLPPLPGANLNGATVSFAYAAANPSDVTRTSKDKSGLDGESYTTYEYFAGNDGLIRLWKPTDGQPSQLDFVLPDHPYTLTELGFENGSRDLTLALEAVNGSATHTAIEVKLVLPSNEVLKDTIRVLPLDPAIKTTEPKIEGIRIVNATTNPYVRGTRGRDLIYGTPESEVIHGFEGNDIIIPDSGDDIVFGDAGQDLLFSWAGDKRLIVGAEDEVSYLEGARAQNRRLSHRTAQQPFGSDSAHALAAAPAPEAGKQVFSSGDILAAYKWAYGADDLWLQAFQAGGGEVIAVESDGHWFSDWSVDWIQNYFTGPWVGYTVKIEYDIGTVLDAANALRQAILEKCARYQTEGFEGFLLAHWADYKVNPRDWGKQFTSWQDVQKANIQFVAEAAELTAGLYYNGMTAAAGVGADLADVVINFTDYAKLTKDVAAKALNLLVALPGSVKNWVQDDTSVLSGKFLEELVNNPAGAAATANFGPAMQAMAAGGQQVARALVKLNTFGAFRATRDVARALVNGVETGVGFVLRKDIEFRIDWHDVGAAGERYVPIIGKAQDTLGPNGVEHAATVTHWATKIIEDSKATKEYLYVGLNRSGRTMLDTGAAVKNGKPGRLLDFKEAKWRPDIFAVYKDKATGAIKVEMFEVPSASQGRREMFRKLDEIRKKIPQQYQTPMTEADNIIDLGAR